MPSRRSTPSILPDPSIPSTPRPDHNDPLTTLSAMFATIDDPGHTRLHLIPIAQIVPSRWQPRQTFPAEPLLELAADIDRHGILTPPILWQNEDGEYELIAGERRVRAAAACAMVNTTGKPLAETVAIVAKDGFVAHRNRLRPHHTIPARLIADIPQNLHEIALVDNLLREDLSPIEEAHALQDLIDEYGYSQRDLAAKISKSQTWISQRLALLRLEPGLAAKVAAGAIDPALARDLARIDPAHQPAALAAITAQNLRTKAAATYIANVLALAEPAAWSTPGAPVEHRLIAAKLDALPEADRHKFALTYTANNTSPKLPQGAGDTARALAAAGVVPPNAGAATHNQALAAAAVAANITCATCQLNPHRSEVIAITDLVKDNPNWRDPAHWPACAARTDTCPAHAHAGAPLRLQILANHNFADNTAGEPDLVSDGWAKYATTLDAWQRITRRGHQLSFSTAAAKTTQDQTTARAAITAYQARQPELDPDHILCQPCARCALARPDGVCSLLDAPPNIATYQTERIWRILSNPDGALISRCDYYRIRDWSDLPDCHGALFIPDGALLRLLPTISTGIYNAGPAWLSAIPHNPDGPTTPTLSQAFAWLRTHLPAAAPAQRLAILLLWANPVPWHIPPNGLPDPLTGATVPWRLLPLLPPPADPPADPPP